MTNTSCCGYSIKTPDDGQYVCPIHVELYIKIKLKIGATYWLVLYEYIMMHGPQNVKYFSQYIPPCFIGILKLNILNDTFRLNSHIADTRNDNDMKMEVI
jgi:hypothetical protein